MKAGRKPTTDKKQVITLYINKSKIENAGGIDSIKTQCYNGLDDTLITDDLIVKIGFNIERNIFFDTISLSLIKSLDGFYYPVLHSEPELSNQDEQIIHLNRISKLNELRKIFDVIGQRSDFVNYI